MVDSTEAHACEFSRTTDLNAAADDVWRHAVSPRGINQEFQPFLIMTFPRGTTDVTEGWRPGEKRFRSWLLLFGFLPIDYDDVVFVQVEPGRGFSECSTLLSQRRWEHERTLEPTATGCRVVDRVRFVPRIAGLSKVYLAVFQLVFDWRHRNLARRFGGGANALR